MQYAILVYENRQGFENRTDETNKAGYWAAYEAYHTALKKAGAIVGGAALQPPCSSTTLQVHAGQRKVQDGPYADTKEQLGGFFLIDVPDLDTAMDWAAKCPAAEDGAVEVRPLLPMNN